MIVKSYVSKLKNEFGGYNKSKFTKDLLAGITVAAVALPLALAFGVSSGATAAAGLITAIFAGLIIGSFSGASYQISGPTGAMTAILASLIVQYGLQGMFIATFIAGILLIIAGILKLGSIVSFLPMPVITGFTSGIAIIIALGQINNLTGLSSKGTNNIQSIISYFKLEQNFDVTAFIIGIAVIAIMIFYPKKLAKICPSSLVAIVVATTANAIFKFDISVVGEIPKTIFLDDRLDFSKIDFSSLQGLLIPAISIATLGLIESLLCGASAERMKNEKIDSNVELVAQGMGNLILPLLGGVPATAAIARTSVAIKSGGQTRLTSVIHAIVLLLSMFVLGGVMSIIPLSALAGVLIVTAFRMNDWSSINSIFGKKIKTAIFQFLITMIATVVFDLTIAILIGVIFSIIMFVIKVSDMQVTVSNVDINKLDENNINPEKLKNTAVVYISGPLYFGTCNNLESKIAELKDNHIVIFSMRGVTVADISGIEKLRDYCENLVEDGKKVYFSCVQPTVLEMMERCKVNEKFKDDLFFWSTDKCFEHISNKVD